MKKNNIFYTLALATIAVMPLASCDDYLDLMPDNRAEVDSEEKVVSLLVSAYTNSGSHMFVTEMMSDNIDDNGTSFTAYTDRFTDQVYGWQDIKEPDNDGMEYYWQDAYYAIAGANLALESIEKLGGATTTTLKAAKGEALLCRAYNHFMLVNVFCLNYNTKTSTTDAGIPYVEETEKTLNPTYERGTVAGVYEKIERDLVEGLSLISDSHLTIPKYHFNKQAAYAFAARFYLYYEKWEESLKYANLCIGTNPKSLLRDWSALAKLPDSDAITRSYIDADQKSNMLIVTSVSMMGLWCNGAAYRSKYSHNEYLAQTEGIFANHLWGDYDTYADTYYSSIYKTAIYAGKRGPLNIVFTPKMPYIFEELDNVNHTGYYRTVQSAFKTDLTLLERAEAYVMLKQYDKACEDLKLWIDNFVVERAANSTFVTPDSIQSFYSRMPYHTWNNGTLKKHLHPAFAIDEEGSVQEAMLHQVLNCKRLEMGYEGYRWFDVKRYGIVIHRRTLNEQGEPMNVTDSLTVDDPRRAIQIPQEAITSGLPQNTRERIEESTTQYVQKVDPSSSIIK